MRLLTRESSGELVLHEFIGNDIPTYAILSHTWGVNGEEVSFQDLEAGIGKSKSGYRKIEFCGKRADTDGLRYFWIDTCCIDKRNNTELSEAINSMFRWYQKAARCYVYLSDVFIDGHESTNPSASCTWEPAFRQSRWFTRGWTLQELVAPTIVDFYSAEGKLLGSKSSLNTIIHEVTGIAKKALEGDPLSDFSVRERFSWAAQCRTKLEEDQMYSLLGIFDISMSLIYGEGKENASRRLNNKINKRLRAPRSEEFGVSLNLSKMPEAAHFVARGTELAEMHRLLSDSSETVEDNN